LYNICKQDENWDEKRDMWFNIKSCSVITEYEIYEKYMYLIDHFSNFFSGSGVEVNKINSTSKFDNFFFTVWDGEWDIPFFVDCFTIVSDPDSVLLLSYYQNNESNYFGHYLFIGKSGLWEESDDNKKKPDVFSIFLFDKRGVF
jgi:hypothetical protein